jgi:LAO/AO transport system kinase
MRPFFVYLLRCADRSFYVGHTDELERRVAQHQAGELPGYTHSRRPVALVWSQETATREEALSRERQIKRWGRAKKEALVRGDRVHLSGPSKAHGGVSTGSARTSNPVRAELVEAPLAVALLKESSAQRRALAKAITLLESTRADHRTQADALLNDLLPHARNALRIGISGVPGVGKSTFIETLGLQIVEQGHRLAVLAVDPTSQVSGGSILGDKTRMERLSVHPRAFVRPSPTGGTLGGVAEKTREAMLACEAAGHDIVIVETVGVGQSEAAVAGMTDLFVLLLLPNAGDDLQAIKRGVMELADFVLIQKCDLDPDAATRAQAQVTSARRIVDAHADVSRVMQVSALTGAGLAGFWQAACAVHAQRLADGSLAQARHAQDEAWMWERIQAELERRFRQHPAVQRALPTLRAEVRAGTLAPSVAARRLLDLAH